MEGIDFLGLRPKWEEVSQCEPLKDMIYLISKTSPLSCLPYSLSSPLFVSPTSHFLPPLFTSLLPVISSHLFSSTPCSSPLFSLPAFQEMLYSSMYTAPWTSASIQAHRYEAKLSLAEICETWNQNKSLF